MNPKKQCHCSYLLSGLLPQIGLHLLCVGLVLGPMDVLAQAPSTSQGFFDRAFSLDLRKEPERPRNYILPPLISFVLPGFDQWAEGQQEAGFTYSSLGVTGLVVGSSAWYRFNNRGVRGATEIEISDRDNEVRQYLLGVQLYSAAGSLSAYHSFRSAVRTRQAQGQFAFLSQEESVDEILKSPFRFSYLRRPTTYYPLLLGTAAVGVIWAGHKSLFTRNQFNFADAFYSGSFSYLAGTHEEALFRGWMMPVLMESWKSPLWSNTATAAVFAAAHYSQSNKVPVFQFVAGWYLGYLTQKNNWTLSEAIFVHTWWDVIIFSGLYFVEARARPESAILNLPPITFSF